MQQSSKGTVDEVKEEVPRKDECSAFRPVLNTGMVRKTSTSSNKRDSGYMTDNSPALLSGNLTTSKFSFDNIGEMDKTNSVDESCVPDDYDQEVEMVLTGRELPQTPPPVVRPPPPAPEVMLNSPVDTSYDNDDVFQNVHETFSSRRFRLNNRHFRPIHDRTVATQTPSLHSQLITEVTNSMSDRFHPYHPHIARGTAYTRLRHFSEGEEPVPHFEGDLPDVIPVHRDRSVSLPDVHQHERVREVGQELRRLSDAFNHSYATQPGRPRRVSMVLPEQLQGVHDQSPVYTFRNMWDNLCHIFSTSPINIVPDQAQRLPENKCSKK